MSDTVSFPKSGWLHKCNIWSLVLTLKHMNLDFMGLKSVLNLFCIVFTNSNIMF